MPTLAATTTQPAATESDALLDFIVGLLPVAVLLLTIWTAGYLIRCWLFPFTICPHPERRHHGTADAWRHQTWRAMRCPRCQGTALRLRAGRRLINHIGATRRRYHR